MTDPAEQLLEPERPGRRLQLADLPVAHHELEHFDSESETVRQARRLARLVADQELISELQWQNFDGPGWRRLATALAEYGFPVVTAWLRSGKMIEQCRKKYFRGVQPLPIGGLTKDQAMELAGLTVSEAIPRFRDEVLIQHRWDFRRGASLKTYFIGFCCIVYVDVYRRWRTDERRRPGDEGREVAYASDRSFRSADPPRPDTVAVTRAMAADLLARTTNKVDRRILERLALGHKEKAVAEELGLSETAVWSRVYRMRDKHRSEVA